MNTSLPHVQFASLVEMAEKRTFPQHAQAAAHVSACDECAAQLAKLQRIIGLMRTDATGDAPHNARAYALNLFDARRTASASSHVASDDASLVSRVRAALSFDSLRDAPAYGLRSAQSTARQLLFSAGENDLDLRVAASGEGMWVVSGQVLGACAGGEIELETTEGATVSVAVLNDMCEFVLPAVPSGVYTLRLRLGDREVEVPELELRA